MSRVFLTEFPSPKSHFSGSWIQQPLRPTQNGVEIDFSVSLSDCLRLVMKISQVSSTTFTMEETCIACIILINLYYLYCISLEPFPPKCSIKVVFLITLQSS